nr:uncharacterized protein LOC102395067 isoform X2 [Bubalus bubalis]
MKILLFFSISFFFDVFILPVDSRSVGNTLSPPKVTCLRKLEKLHSETHNSSTIFENAQYGTEEKQKARKRFPHYGSVDMRRECAKEVQMTEEKKETHVPRRRDQCYCLPSQPFCTSFQACVSLSCAKN